MQVAPFLAAILAQQGIGDASGKLGVDFIECADLRQRFRQSVGGVFEPEDIIH